MIILGNIFKNPRKQKFLIILLPQHKHGYPFQCMFLYCCYCFMFLFNSSQLNRVLYQFQVYYLVVQYFHISPCLHHQCSPYIAAVVLMWHKKVVYERGFLIHSGWIHFKQAPENKARPECILQSDSTIFIRKLNNKVMG